MSAFGTKRTFREFGDMIIRRAVAAGRLFTVIDLLAGPPAADV